MIFALIGGEPIRRHRIAELDHPVRWQRDRAKRPQPGEERRYREVGQLQLLGQFRPVSDHRIDLLGADDRARDDRGAGAQRYPGEPAAAESLQLVPLAEWLADSLETLGKDPDELALVQ